MAAGEALEAANRSGDAGVESGDGQFCDCDERPPDFVPSERRRENTRGQTGSAN